MARSEMEENLNDKGVVVNELICAEGKVKVKVGSGKIRDYNLCHGKLGEAAILYILGRREMGEELFQKIVAELGQAQGEIRDLLGQQECENYGFMSGICGLGYACLGNVEKVANIVRIATASEP